MYFGHIANYQPNRYPTAIQFALDYLKNTDFDAMETGVYELKGKQIFVQVLDLECKEKSAYFPEVHQNYLDVQYLHKGLEKMATAVDSGNNPVQTPYNAERDIQFYQQVENEQELSLVAGNFAVFFPEDAHRTAIFNGTETIRKVVVKIAVSEL